MRIDEARAVFVVDGVHHPIRERVYEVGGKRHRVEFRKTEIPRGQTGTVRLVSYAVLPKDRLGSVERVEVILPVGPGEVRASFGEVAAAPLVRGKWQDRLE